MFTMNTQSRRDYKLLNDSVVARLVNEGTSLEGLENQVEKITYSYLLAVKCLWIRLPKVNVDNFIVKYQELTAKAMLLLDTYKFEDLVFTFRSINTNLYEVHTNIGRTYNLNYSSYSQFLDDVSSKKIQVLSKQPKSTKTAKSKKTATSQKTANTFSNAFGLSVNTQVKTQKVATKVAKKQVKKTVKPLETKVSKGWHKFDTSKLPLENTFLKIAFKDNVKSVYGKFQYFSTIKKDHFLTFKVKDELITVPTYNLKQVYYYQR